MNENKPTPEQIKELEALIEASRPTEHTYPAEGKDLDHTKYTFEDGSEGFYSRAKLDLNAPDGPRYVFQTYEWLSESKSYSGQARGQFSENGTPRNLGEYLTFMELQEEPWQTFNVMPNGSGLGAAIMRRPVLRVLPLPTPIATTEEIKTEALASVPDLESNIEKWAQEQGAPEVSND